MLTGVPSLVWVPCFGLAITAVMLYASYATFARYLKWLSAVLLAYIASAVLAGPDWLAALAASLIPRVQWTSEYVTTVVAILGTTISPYLFFWQASLEVEEDRRRGRTTLAARRGVTELELRDARLDVNTGMGFSNLVMYFIILATATTLHQAGHRDITSSRQAAEALRPLAGDAAYLLFGVGLIGAGLLAIPVLAGAASYAIAELFAWREGLDLRPCQARGFYRVFAGAIVAGVLLEVFDTNPIRMLFWSAVLNGLLAPPLMVLVMLIGNNRHIMGPHTSTRALNVLGWTATVMMTAAAVAFFATSF
jgi:Mn2+/Fe2+ NRAMP family transporter